MSVLSCVNSLYASMKIDFATNIKCDGEPRLYEQKHQVQRVFLVGNLHGFLPIALALPSAWRMPDEDGVGMCHVCTF